MADHRALHIFKQWLMVFCSRLPFYARCLLYLSIGINKDQKYKSVELGDQLGVLGSSIVEFERSILFNYLEIL